MSIIFESHSLDVATISAATAVLDRKRRLLTGDILPLFSTYTALQNYLTSWLANSEYQTKFNFSVKSLFILKTCFKVEDFPVFISIFENQFFTKTSQNWSRIYVSGCSCFWMFTIRKPKAEKILTVKRLSLQKLYVIT